VVMMVGSTFGWMASKRAKSVIGKRWPVAKEGITNTRSLVSTGSDTSDEAMVMVRYRCKMSEEEKCWI
jgi:hypothetical protein